eukprot:4197624-Karenia_brevis.AAC.1
MYGGGIRSLESLSPAAFVAAVSRTIPQMIDSCSTNAERRAGFLPPLVGVLGAGSFDGAPGAQWYAHMLMSGTRLSSEFSAAW